MSSSNAELWSSLDSELGSLLDHFTSLVRASRIQTEDDSHGVLSTTGTREKRAPGDMLQVWVEKVSVDERQMHGHGLMIFFPIMLGFQMIHSGHTSLHILSQLKKGAITSDFNLLLGHVRSARKELEGNLAEGGQQLVELKKELWQLDEQRRRLNQSDAMES